ncbi:hypothetical protein ACEWY4_022905 [Coilia grayii]|uniref:Ig-like domain-containing protein n=1 Tax=Coilia grayii TaxID=363190 RepID=A0ABD1J1P2_9TELE
MSFLKINCTVKYCEEQPNVTWCKFVDGADCKAVGKDSNVKIWQEPVHNEINLIMSYMEIKQTTKGYSGEYSCRVSHSVVGHTINVTVISNAFSTLTSVTFSDELSTTDSKHLNHSGWLPYVIICVAIVTLVVLVMLISFLILHGCKRSSRSYHTEPKGSSQAQKTEHTVQDSCPTRRPSARMTPSPSVPKRDRSLRHHPTQSPALRHQPAHATSLNGTSLQGLLTLPRAPSSPHPDSDPRSAMTHGSPGNSRDRRPSQVLYATLDHLAPKDASRTHPKIHPEEEFSEYASIRVS